MEHYTYLLINLFTLAGPLSQSFDKKLWFVGRLKYFVPACVLTAIFFLVWDSFFTAQGIWGFTPRYLVGVDLGNLPLEEWLFFITVPYACVFTYECIPVFAKRDILVPYTRFITTILVLLFLGVGLLNMGKWYTLSSTILTALLLSFIAWGKKSTWLPRFYLAYLLILAPFFFVNGILTGTGLEEPVVWYNNNHNLGIRLFTIPIEDAVYGMLLMLMNISWYEFLKSKALKQD